MEEKQCLKDVRYLKDLQVLVRKYREPNKRYEPSPKKHKYYKNTTTFIYYIQLKVTNFYLYLHRINKNEVKVQSNMYNRRETCFYKNI